MSTSRFPPATNDATEAGTYVVQTSTNKPPNAQVLASLTTGLMKVTAATGVVSTAAKTTDYPDPAATFIVQTATAAPTNAQTLASLSSGVALVTTTTGVVTTFASTSTRIPFGSGANGAITDSANLIWDGTSMKVGVAETPAVPSAILQIYASSNAFMVVRDTTNDVEMSLGNASTTGVIGSQTNHKIQLITNNTARATVPAAGGFVVGTAAIATNATDGFVYIPTCAGTPTGTPTTQTGTVAMVFDTTNHKLYIFDGSWKGGTTPGLWT